MKWCNVLICFKIIGRGVNEWALDKTRLAMCTCSSINFCVCSKYFIIKSYKTDFILPILPHPMFVIFVFLIDLTTVLGHLSLHLSSQQKGKSMNVCTISGLFICSSSYFLNEWINKKRKFQVAVRKVELGKQKSRGSQIPFGCLYIFFKKFSIKMLMRP